MNKPPADNGSNECDIVVTFDQKDKLEKEYRKLLIDDLLNNRTKFAAGPYDAHLQFSNFCNMSCIMCWNGNNPPTQKTSPELLEKIGQQLGPHLSVVTPYSGSEPLVLTWDETRDMAKKYGILLCITTNVQFLDEAKFHDLKDIAETLILSIDSHNVGIFDKIRPRSNSKKVFANLETTARLCVEHDLECIVNIVFMTQNTPLLTDTLNYLADLGIQNVNIIQLLDVNGDSRMYDPLLHYSEEYIAWIKRECVATARERKFRLIWSIAGYHEYDFREPGFVPIKTRKLWNDEWDLRMKRMFPGFCRNAYNRLRVNSEADVAPCCYATEGELSMGNLNTDDFEAIWNSPSAQDLRRGMFTGDVPALCRSCRFHDTIEPADILPFVESDEEAFSKLHGVGSKQAIASVEIVEPAHGVCSSDPVEFKIVTPAIAIEKFLIALSLGGEADEVFRQVIEPVSESDGVLTFELAAETWNQLKSNVGYWWMIWGIPDNKDQKPVRCTEVRCLIRHNEMPRIEGSTLRYHDQGFVPVSDLGGGKKEGWGDKEHVPDRPEVAVHGRANLSLQAFVPQQISPAQSTAAAAAIANGGTSGTSATKPRANILSRIFGSRDEAGIEDANLEVVAQEKDGLRIGGWILLRNGAADTIEIEASNGTSIAAAVVERADIAKGFPKIETAANSGFSAILPDDSFWNQDRYQFVIVAKRAGRVEFRCQVSCKAGAVNEANQVHSIRHGVLDI